MCWLSHHSSLAQVRHGGGARPLNSLVTPSSASLHRYVIVVEHDLSVLDYLSDFICCLYGEAALVSAHSRVDACKPSHTGGPRRRDTPLSRHHVSLFSTATTARR